MLSQGSGIARALRVLAQLVSDGCFVVNGHPTYQQITSSIIVEPDFISAVFVHPHYGTTG